MTGSNSRRSRHRTTAPSRALTTTTRTTLLTTSTPSNLTAAELLDQADALFVEADEALAAGDLGTYQARIEEARALVSEAVELLEGT